MAVVGAAVFAARFGAVTMLVDRVEAAAVLVVGACWM